MAHGQSRDTEEATWLRQTRQTLRGVRGPFRVAALLHLLVCRLDTRLGHVPAWRPIHPPRIRQLETLEEGLGLDEMEDTRLLPANGPFLRLDLKAALLGRGGLLERVAADKFRRPPSRVVVLLHQLVEDIHALLELAGRRTAHAPHPQSFTEALCRTYSLGSHLLLLGFHQDPSYG